MRQIVLVTLASILGVGLVLGIASLVNTQPGFAGTLASSPLGWIVPLASLLVIFGVIWLLLSQGSGRGNADGFKSVACPSCGRQVMPDWRLCPYCGWILDEPTGDVRPAER